MHTRAVELQDVSLVIAEAGQGGRPLLLLHGFTGAKEDFTEWLDRLADAGWHAVAPDHRGHGASGKPAAEDAYSIAILADDAIRLADFLGWDRFALLGHSMGGYIAGAIALKVPGRLTALVLMDTSHTAVEGIEMSDVELALEIVRTQGTDVLADILATREGILETAAHRRVVAERPGYAEENDRKLRAAAPAMYAAIAPELLRYPDALGGLAAMRPVPPTLVVVGEQDAPFIPASERMAKAIPGAELAVIDDAGHSPQFENPDGWWAALSGFLAGVPA
jgi:pimeloyl-ACP methyl ester carboxylesterase